MTNQHPRSGRFTPDNPEAQPKATLPDREGAEHTTGPEGQTTTGRKVEGQETNVAPVAGQSTKYRPSDRPNR